MDETALIRSWFASATPLGDDVRLGIGDDCALVTVPADRELAVCTDTLVEGCHFAHGAEASAIGWKALAVNLSDLAAMGAQPRWCTLALTLPRVDPQWLDAFTSGFAALAREYDVTLVGGDTTRGPLSITVTAAGWLAPGQALQRGGAKAGDLVCVTGTLGDAALALRLRATAAHDAGNASLFERLDRPRPRVAAGLAMVGLATAAIDLSDGLGLDLWRILDASAAGAELDAAALPRSPTFKSRAGDEASALELQLAGGDDYELCLCLRPADLPQARRMLAALDLPLTVIGRIDSGRGLRLRCGGTVQTLAASGFDHFRTDGIE